MPIIFEWPDGYKTRVDKRFLKEIINIEAMAEKIEQFSKKGEKTKPIAFSLN